MPFNQSNYFTPCLLLIPSTSSTEYTPFTRFTPITPFILPRFPHQLCCCAQLIVLESVLDLAVLPLKMALMPFIVLTSVPKDTRETGKGKSRTMPQRPSEIQDLRLEHVLPVPQASFKRHPNRFQDDPTITHPFMATPLLAYALF